MGLRPLHLTLGAAIAAAALTIFAAVAPYPSAYRSPSLHAALETAAGLIALLAAYLLFGRFRQNARAGDLALACALSLFAFANLFFSALPAAGAGRGTTFATWAPLATRLLATVVFAAAPFLQRRTLPDPDRYLRAGLLAVGTSLAAIAVAVGVAAPALPAAVEGRLSSDDFRHLSITGNPVVLAAHLLAAGLFAVAAVASMRRAERDGDELVRWLAPGAAIAAFAHLNYFLIPSLYSSWVYVGDFLRLGFYLLALVGVARVIGAYQRDRTISATLEERRRLARELHDGLAQELAFIAVQARALAAKGPERHALAQLASAAQRALDESRLAIAALTRPGYEPLEVALAAAAEEVGHRLGAAVKLDLAPGIDVSPDQRDALVRIVREAITNAARHGAAREVTVQLENGDGIHVRIIDAGRGFDVEEIEQRAVGFGLKSMRERAQALGGDLRVVSQKGLGTRIEVDLP